MIAQMKNRHYQQTESYTEGLANGVIYPGSKHFFICDFQTWWEFDKHKFGITIKKTRSPLCYCCSWCFPITHIFLPNHHVITAHYKLHIILETLTLVLRFILTHLRFLHCCLCNIWTLMGMCSLTLIFSSSWKIMCHTVRQVIFDRFVCLCCVMWRTKIWLFLLPVSSYPC